MLNYILSEENCFDEARRYAADQPDGSYTMTVENWRAEGPSVHAVSKFKNGFMWRPADDEGDKGVASAQRFLASLRGMQGILIDQWRFIDSDEPRYPFVWSRDDAVDARVRRYAANRRVGISAMTATDSEVFPVSDDTVFWAQLKIKFEKEFPKQPGRKTLTNDGTTYHRVFRKERSNSGKTFRWLLDFIIVYPDGTTETIHDPSEPNRRNDPSRNWGLGRE